MSSYSIIEIPSFGIGTYTITGEKCTNYVYNALTTHKCKLIDTAELYNNQIDIGNGIKLAINEQIISREDIWITSKIHNRDQRKLNIGPGINKIIKDLDVEYIDLILLHSAQKNYVEAYSELIRLKSHFNIRHIGTSNFRIDELENIINSTNIKPYLNQIEISPFLQRNNLRSFMNTHSIIIQAYSSLTCRKGLEHEKLNHQIYRPDELLLGWAKYYNLKPIPTSHNLEELNLNYQTFNNLNLNLEDVQLLDSITDKIINYKQHDDN